MTPAQPPQDNVDEPHLQGLDEQFLHAIERKENGDVEGAKEAFQEILRVEPRLAEPRMELAGILLAAGELEEALDQIREAGRILELGGQWLEGLDESEVLALAFDLLGEILRRRADTDEVMFGDPAVWRAMVEESQAAFRRAFELDPENTHAADWVDPGLAARPESSASTE